MTVSLESVEEGIVQVGSQKLSIDEVRKLAQAADSSLAEAAIALLMLQDGVVVEENSHEVEEDIPPCNFESEDWAVTEVYILIDNVLDVGYSGVAEMLPNRTYRAIAQKGRKLGLSIGKDRKYQKWSEAEKDFLLQYRDRFTYRELGALLGRTWRAVKNQWERIN